MGCSSVVGCCPSRRQVLNSILPSQKNTQTQDGSKWEVIWSLVMLPSEEIKVILMVSPCDRSSKESKTSPSTFCDFLSHLLTLCVLSYHGAICHEALTRGQINGINQLWTHSLQNCELNFLALYVT